MNEFLPLSGKGALVTGGSRGIGRAVVERLAADGAEVVFNFSHSASAANLVEGIVRERGGIANGVASDFRDDASLEHLIEEARDRLPALDVLVNNAALDIDPTPIADLDDHSWEQLFAVNLLAPFRLIRHAARYMRDNGRIINISTINTSRLAPGIAAYASSKGALETLTRAAATELGPRGITVNAICPGATDTDLLRAGHTEEILVQIAAATPLRRLGEPEDIADFAALLVRDEARWLTGQVIVVAGGLA